MKLKLIPAAVAMIFLVGACSKETVNMRTTDKARQNSPTKSSNDAQGANKDQSSGDSSSSSNPGPALKLQCNPSASLALADGEKIAGEIISGQELSLTFKGQKSSLCDIVGSGGKKTAVFQFIDINCDKCSEPARNIGFFMETSPYYDSMAHILVLFSAKEPVTDASADKYVKAHALNQAYALDNVQNLWGQFAEDASKSDTPTLLAMNLNMQANVIKQQGAAYLQMIPNAEGLLLAYDAAAPKGTPPAKKAVETDWDVESTLGSNLIDIVPME